MLELLRAETFKYFLNEINLKTGLIADKTQPGSPSSIAAVGLGLSCYIIALEHGLISRAESIKRVKALNYQQNTVGAFMVQTTTI